eukprot:g3254.t1
MSATSLSYIGSEDTTRVVEEEDEEESSCGEEEEEKAYVKIVEALESHRAMAPSQAIGSQPSVGKRCFREPELDRLISKMKTNEIVDMLRERATDGDNCGKFSFGNVLQAIFIGLGHAQSCRRKRFSIFKMCIDLMKASVVSGRSAQECIKILLPETYELGDEEIPKLIQSVVAALEPSSVRLVRQLVAELESSNRSTDLSLASFSLLPKLIGLLKEDREYRVVENSTDGGENVQNEPMVMTGGAFKRHVLSRLFEVEWPAGQAAQLAALMMEIPLSQEHIEAATRKVLALIGQSTQFQELPSLVYQLLLLGSNQATKVKRKMLTEMLVQFDMVEAGVIGSVSKKGPVATAANDAEEDRSIALKGRPRELRQVQGTVLLNLNFAAKQDQSAGRALLKIFVEDRWPATPFRVALMMSIATIHRFKARVFEGLRQFVLAVSRHAYDCDTDTWLRSVATRETEETKWIGTAARVDVVRVLTSMSSLACTFWNHVLPTTVEFGFLLVDSKSPNGPFVNASARVDVRMCHTCGNAILATAFKLQKTCRESVLKGILSRVVSNRNDAAARTNMKLLATLVEKHGAYMHSMQDQFKETLEYLPLLSLNVARSFLTAIVPLLRSRASVALRNYAPIVFRKAVFRRELTSRVVAVEGMMIMATTALSSSSAASSSAAFERAREDWQQIGGMLRRALTQQQEVRVATYAGLRRIFRDFSALRGSVSTFLLARLRQLVRSPEEDGEKETREGSDVVDGAAPTLLPIRLDRLVGRMGAPTITEPIGALLGTAIECCAQYRAQNDEMGEGSSTRVSPEMSLGRKIESILSRLIETIPKLELEDLAMDKSTDFSQGQSEGRQNLLRAELLAKAIDALMVHVLRGVETGATSEDDSTARMITLLSLRCDIERIVRQQQSGPASSRQKKQKRLILPLARMEPEQLDLLLSWWFEFFNGEATAERVDDSEDEVAELTPMQARKDMTMQRWILNACVDRFSDSENKEDDEASKRRFALRLAPYLLENFELVQTRAPEQSDDCEKKKVEGKKGNGKHASDASSKKLEDLADLSLLCLCHAADNAVGARGTDGDIGLSKSVAADFMTKLLSATAPTTSPSGDVAAVATVVTRDDDEATLHQHATTLWQLAEHLAKKTFFKRAERLIHHTLEPAISFLTDSMHRREHSNSALRLLKGLGRSISGMQGTLRSLVGIATRCSDNSESLTVPLLLTKICAEAAAKRVPQQSTQASQGCEVAGRGGDIEYPIIARDPKVGDLVLNGVLRCLNAELASIERAVSALSPILKQWMCANEWFQNPRVHDSKSRYCGDVAGSLALRQEMICRRTMQVVEVLEVVVCCEETGESTTTHLFKTLVRCYKLLSSTIASAVAQSDNVAPRTAQHMRELHSRVGAKGNGLTMKLYKFLSKVAQQKVAANTKSDNNASRERRRGGGKKTKAPARESAAQIKRQSKQIPQLVYEIEQLEYSYLKLLRSSKNDIDFTMFMQRSTSRDFRIRPCDFVTSGAEEEDEEEEGDSSEDDEDEEEEEREDNEEEEEGMTTATEDENVGATQGARTKGLGGSRKRRRGVGALADQSNGSQPLSQRRLSSSPL